MSALSTRLPDSLHNQAKEIARQEGISINQLIATALAETLSALMTETYLVERASRGSDEKFRAVFAKIRDIAPEPDDRLEEMKKSPSRKRRQ